MGPSFKVDPKNDRVFLNNSIVTPLKKQYVILNKPKGITTTKMDRFAAKTIMDLLPRKLRHLNPAGRLDKDTSGLLLLTNDGELLNRLTHPRFEVSKIYSVKLDRKLRYPDKKLLEKGILLDGKYTAPCHISLKCDNIIEVTLREGRKRQIKRIFAKAGYEVIDLKRIKEDFLGLRDLKTGQWRFLDQKEILTLTQKK